LEEVDAVGDDGGVAGSGRVVGNHRCEFP